MTAATGWGWEGVGWERAAAETAAGMETVATAAMAAVRLRGRRVRGGLEGCCLSEQGFVGRGLLGVGTRASMKRRLRTKANRCLLR